MTPAQARSALDRFLSLYGQPATLQRGAASVELQAHVSDFTPRDLEGADGLQIGDSKVVISTTQLNAVQWPLEGESRIPRKGDRLVVAGRTRMVLYGYAAPYIAGELIRLELAIR